MYIIYAAYINIEGKIVVDGENGRNTYTNCTIEQAKQLYAMGK